MSQCPKCGSNDVAYEERWEDIWRNGGHDTRVTGMGGLCLDCNHEWDVEPNVNDDPDPDDFKDYIDCDNLDCYPIKYITPNSKG